MKCFSSNPLEKRYNAPACLVNAVIHALNESKKMPKLILILPDWDIVKMVGDVCFGISAILHSIIKWVVTNIHRSLEIRKDDLFRRKASAIASG